MEAIFAAAPEVEGEQGEEEEETGDVDGGAGGPEEGRAGGGEEKPLEPGERGLHPARDRGGQRVDADRAEGEDP